MDDDDNIFDDDDALDYIMSEEVEKESDRSKTTSGCLGLILILVIPSTLLGIVVSYL